MEITFKLTRRNAQANGEQAEQSYIIDVDPQGSLLDALHRVQEEQDGSLAFRGACGRGFCGGCTMKANGASKVACLCSVESVAKDGAITLAPPTNTRVIKDIIYDTDRFLWSKYKEVRPWVVTNGKSVTEEALEPVRLAMRCTMCGLCDEGCTVIDVDKDFLGPAALTKLYRTVKDPRDTQTKERFVDAGGRRGLWDCVHCWEASEHCPWGINPTHLIMEMRDQSIALGVKSGQDNKIVARHYDAFANSVAASGWLNERQLAQKTYGLPPYGLSPSGILSQMPIAIKALRRGKANLSAHIPRGGAEEIKKVFQKVEEARRKQQEEKGDEKQ